MVIKKIKVIQFSKNQIQFEIDNIIFELKDRDCQRVEFLRGMLSVYLQILNDKGYTEIEQNSIF
jgi:hypothetical protein